MKQADLDRAVARATGETVSTIKRLGFLLDDSADHSEPNPEPYGPHVVDWDELEARRHQEVTRRPTYEPAAA